MIERISNVLCKVLREFYFLHGTPRQWCDSNRVLVRNENDKMVHLKLEELEGNYGSVRNIISVTGGQSENTLEIIEDMDVCWMFHKLHADKDDDDDVHFRTSTMLDHKEKGGVFTNTNKEMASKIA